MKLFPWWVLILAWGHLVHPVDAPRWMATGTQLPSGCLPNFPYKDGWLGGDAAYSIPLAAGQSLWLFGDSFVARTSQSRRQGARFVRNSMAISTCDARNGWQIKYYWGHQNRSAPRAFFDSGTNKYWYWPLDGFVYQGRLYIALSKVKDNPKEKLLSFETIGVNLAKVSNLSAPPSQWKIEYLKLVEGGAAIPGSAIVLNDGYVYFFTLYDEPARRHQHMILSRLPLEKLANPAAHLEYFAKDQSWKAGLNRDDALVVMETGHSEMSVRYHPEIKQWLAVSGADFLSPQIVMRTAPALTGPWSAWQTIYEIPEMNPKTPGRDPDTWCYAVKEHIEFAQAQKLLVTYACNSFKLEKLISNMGLYRPQAVLIELPPPVTHRPLFLPHPQLNSADQARPPSSPEENL